MGRKTEMEKDRVWGMTGRATTPQHFTLFSPPAEERGLEVLNKSVLCQNNVRLVFPFLQKSEFKLHVAQKLLCLFHSKGSVTLLLSYLSFANSIWRPCVS